MRKILYLMFHWLSIMSTVIIVELKSYDKNAILLQLPFHIGNMNKLFNSFFLYDISWLLSSFKIIYKILWKESPTEKSTSSPNSRSNMFLESVLVPPIDGDSRYVRTWNLKRYYSICYFIFFFLQNISHTSLSFATLLFLVKLLRHQFFWHLFSLLLLSYYYFFFHLCFFFFFY